VTTAGGGGCLPGGGGGGGFLGGGDGGFPGEGGGGGLFLGVGLGGRYVLPGVDGIGLEMSFLALMKKWRVKLSFLRWSRCRGCRLRRRYRFWSCSRFRCSCGLGRRRASWII
jgi:hypothetical protein